MKPNRLSINSLSLLLIIQLITILLSCRKLVEVPTPSTGTNGANVFNSDPTAAAVLTGLYSKIASQDIVGGGLLSLSLFPALSGDELTLFNGVTRVSLITYYRNELTSSSVDAGADFWYQIYPNIYIVNSAIEGLNNSIALTPTVKKQLLGEAMFMRAFCYFYLVNLYGDVPLVLNTDYKRNSTLPRTSKDSVWRQIISDLKEAQDLLNNNYVKNDLVTVSVERIRPNKFAATALLARAYLYKEDWANAEIASSMVINTTNLYDTVSLSQIFLKNSKEAIWQLQPVLSNQNTPEGKLFLLPASGPSSLANPVYLNLNLVTSFENGDKRKNEWIKNSTVGTTVYSYPNKYKVGAITNTNPPTPVSEYSIVLRLAEQFLIRAEARVQLNKLSEAQNDLNVIRQRAGLPNILLNDKISAIAAIIKERKAELFTEWGHRWLDLKRTNAADTLMPSATQAKGGTWQSTDKFYPIMLSELQKNQNLIQNPGY